MSALGRLNCGMCLLGWCRETVAVSTRRAEGRCIRRTSTSAQRNAAPLRLGLATALGFDTSWVVGNGSRGRDPSLDVTFVIFCEKVSVNDERA
jgi:hypothetical protein